jgi:SNF2 family DNA or RNA helicase
MMSSECYHINGRTVHDDRSNTISTNKFGGEIFIFLLTTHTGCFGINLTMGNIIILYDSDWYVLCG